MTDKSKNGYKSGFIAILGPGITYMKIRRYKVPVMWSSLMKGDKSFMNRSNLSSKYDLKVPYKKCWRFASNFKISREVHRN